MHVSPFMEMDMHYDMKFTISGDMETNSIPANEALPTRLGVKITNFQQGVKIFDVAMSLKSKPITPTSLWLTLFKYPLISWKVFAGIYWQAARLYWKKVPFVAHPGKRQKESQQPGISQSDDRSATANSESLTNEESETVLAGQ